VGMSLMVDTLWVGPAPCMVTRGHFSLDKPCTTWYYNNSDDDKEVRYGIRYKDYR